MSPALCRLPRIEKLTRNPAVSSRRAATRTRSPLCTVSISISSSRSRLAARFSTDHAHLGPVPAPDLDAAFEGGQVHVRHAAHDEDVLFAFLRLVAPRRRSRNLRAPALRRLRRPRPPPTPFASLPPGSVVSCEGRRKGDSAGSAAARKTRGRRGAGSPRRGKRADEVELAPRNASLARRFGPSPPLHDPAPQHFATLRSAAQTPRSLRHPRGPPGPVARVPPRVRPGGAGDPSARRRPRSDPTAYSQNRGNAMVESA